MDTSKKIKEAVKKVVPRFVINRYIMIRDAVRIRRLLEQPVGAYVRGIRPEGVNLYGDFVLGTGLSRSVNLLHTEMELAGVPHSLHQVEEFSGIPDETAAGGDQTDYAVNIFHLQPSIIYNLLKLLPKERRDGHYNIAHWVWETPEVPKEWIPLFDAFDEIWTPSVFAARAFRHVTDKPIRVYPHGVVLPDRKEIDRSELREKYGIDKDTMICLVMYDGLSGMDRKNPDAAIKAFVKAFPDPSEKVVLLIKEKNPGKKEEEYLKSLLNEDTAVIRIEGKLSYEETEKLLASVDVLISLHRAEGFGLPVAEVMSYGGVVVSTDYSATKEFVNGFNGFPVSYRMVRTKTESPSYHKGTIWAEPDIDDAAAKLRRAYEDPGLRKSMGKEAESSISEKLSAVKIGARIKRRIDVICGVTDETDVQ